MTIELTDDEFENLILMCGYAAGVALKSGDRRQLESFLRTVNAVNRDNPRWIPYEVDPLDPATA